MTTYRVTAPDGTKYKINAPEGATEEEALAFAQQQFAKPADWEGSSNQEKKPFNIGEMLGNVPGSAYDFGKNLVSAVAHPIDTASGAFDLAAGAARNLVPQGLREAIDKLDPNPQAAQRASSLASKAGEQLGADYGSLEGFKAKVQRDPVGAIADVSTVLGVGGAMAPGKVSGILNAASKVTNPLQVIPAAGKAVGFAGKNVLGLTTGVGAENVSQAVKAGQRADPKFLDNIRGDVPITSLLDDAKQGLESMRQQKSAAYRQDMKAVAQDKSVLGFGGIDKALSDAASMVSYKGQVKNTKAAQAVQSMADDVAEWKKLDPAEFHTPEGLDALKQRLNGVLESIPFEEKTARLAAGKVYNAVKDEIQKQAPGYAKTMADYTRSSEQISEIERALSLGGRASQDTAIRKLQSLARNNAQTNYGNRLDLAKQLEAQGGVDILPSVAGQAMSSALPRGLVGQGGALFSLGGAAYGASPYTLLALPFQSPKAVGLGAYGAGRAAGLLGRGAGKIGLTPERARLAGLLGYELGRE